MDIKFNCNKCWEHVVIDETGAGMTVQCPSCGASLNVPSAENAAEFSTRPHLETTSSNSEQIEYEIESGWLKIKRLDFFGQFSRSPDSRYMLAWRDERTGLRTWGQYLLLENNSVIVSGKMQRPNDGKVSNGGSFILNDWMFNKGETLAGTFYAFAPNGEVLLRKKFRANLNTNGLSDNGRFAYCDTCTSDCKAHSDKMFIFDLETKTLLSTIEGRAGQRCRFDVANRILSFINDDATECRYTLEGNPLGAEKLTGERLNSFINFMEEDLQKQQYDSSRRNLHQKLMDLYTMSNAPLKVAEHRAALIKLMEQEVRQEFLPESSRAYTHKALADLYQANGDELEAKKHSDTWLQSAVGKDVFEFAENQIKKLKGTDLAIYAEAIALMLRALERGVSSKYQFRIHRTLGQIYHRCHDTAKAIEHLEIALSIDSSVGVQNLLKRLKPENQNG